jgi:hypothetical protein
MQRSYFNDGQRDPKRSSSIANDGDVGDCYVAGQMTPDQIAEAQRLAREWLAAHPEKCSTRYYLEILATLGQSGHLLAAQ